MRFFLLTIASCIALPLSIFASEGSPKGKDKKSETIYADSRRDTTAAVVVYNAATKFIPNARLTVEDYTHMIDSLVMLDTIPVSLVNQLNVYRNLSNRKRSELWQVVDSIFDSPNVPRPVVNAVNIYLSAIEEEMAAPKGFYAHIPADDSPYPANAFYQNWNTNVAHPFRNNLADFDSTLTLLLVDEEQDCGFSVPFEGPLTSHFGWRWGRNHNGTDIDLNVWDPVVAAFPGVVRVSRAYKGYGRVVVIRHYNGLETLYAHLHRLKLKPGDTVEAGDVIGLGGNSGNSTGSHLHFEVRFQGVPINPATLINFREGKLKSNTITLRKSGAFLAVVTPAQLEKEQKMLARTGSHTYEVKKGDYLYKIAREQGISVEEICAANKLRPNQTLQVGQKLRLGT